MVVSVGGLTMLAYGLWAQKDDMGLRAMQLITLSLPVLVVVLALVFGQNSDAKLLGKDFLAPWASSCMSASSWATLSWARCPTPCRAPKPRATCSTPAPVLLQCADGSDCQALILYRSLPKDFLLEPAQRLYFIQDLSFFMAGVWHALHTKAPPHMTHWVLITGGGLRLGREFCLAFARAG